MPVTIESVIIVLIGILDLASTLFLVHHHGAQEANPIFSRYLAMGTPWFIASKVIMLLAPVVLLEWARRRRPRFTRWASRFAIAAYLALYLVGFAHLNPDLLHGRPSRSQLAMAVPPNSRIWMYYRSGKRRYTGADSEMMARAFRNSERMHRMALQREKAALAY